MVLEAEKVGIEEETVIGGSSLKRDDYENDPKVKYPPHLQPPFE